MTTSPPPPPSGLPTPKARLKQFLQASLVVLLLGAGTTLARRETGPFTLIVLAILLLLPAWWLARRNREEAATRFALVLLTLTVSGLLWLSGGTMDPALLAFPCILVFAAILGRGPLFFSLLGLMVGTFAVLAWAGPRGLLPPSSRPMEPSIALDLSSLILLSGFGIWTMSRDLRRALERMAAEDRKLSFSKAHNEFLANHDPLTGLPNRHQGQRRLQQAINQANRMGGYVALLQLDVDHFKDFNTSFGHQAGDHLLQDIAARIQRVLRASDTLCRHGGDEFMVVLGDLESGEVAAGIAERIQECLKDQFCVKDMALPMTASLGIALYPDDGGDFESLAQSADTAMYQAKECGRKTYRFFNPDMNRSAVEHTRMVADLRLALERGEFVLHYQPQLCLTTGRIVGAEALIRWQHPERGLILPGLFVPVAEKSGQIVDIGSWVILEACHQGRKWMDQGLDLVVSVNLSPLQFRKTDLEATFVQALAASGLPPSRLDVELTESMLLDDSPETTRKLDRLNALGLGLSIDDFGTGYSNLSYLHRLEVGRLKIDRSFVREIGSSPQNEAIAKAIIQVSKTLQLTTVAEGIEDQDALDRLTDLGCDQGQGFFWSKALAPEAFEAFVLSHRPQAQPADQRGSRSA